VHLGNWTRHITLLTSFVSKLYKNISVNARLILATNPPEIVMKSNSQTSVNVTWKIDDKSKNKCPLSWIAVTCNAPDYNNSNAPWIITDPPSVALNISSPTASFRFPMTIEDLSPFTNYTCFALVTNSAGNSSTTRFEFTTDQDGKTFKIIVN
jgi:hypothetical protein